MDWRTKELKQQAEDQCVSSVLNPERESELITKHHQLVVYNKHIYLFSGFLPCLSAIERVHCQIYVVTGAKKVQ